MGGGEDEVNTSSNIKQKENVKQEENIQQKTVHYTAKDIQLRNFNSTNAPALHKASSNSKTIYADEVTFESSDVSTIKATNVQDALVTISLDLRKYLPNTTWKVTNITRDKDDSVPANGTITFDGSGNASVLDGAWITGFVKAPDGTCNKENDANDIDNSFTFDVGVQINGIDGYYRDGEDDELRLHSMAWNGGDVSDLIDELNDVVSKIQDDINEAESNGENTDELKEKLYIAQENIEKVNAIKKTYDSVVANIGDNFLDIHHKNHEDCGADENGIKIQWFGIGVMKTSYTNVNLNSDLPCYTYFHREDNGTTVGEQRCPFADDVNEHTNVSWVVSVTPDTITMLDGTGNISILEKK